MKSIFIFLFSFTLFAAQSEFDINKRWINKKGWPIPDVNKMKFEKSEVLKDIIPEWICVKTYVVDENEKYTLRTNKIKSNFIVSDKIGEIDIHRVSIYYLCDSNIILFYLVTFLEVEERDPEFGISGDILVNIMVDLNQDGIFESRFEGSGGMPIYIPDTPEESNQDINQALKYFAKKWRNQKCTPRKN